MQSKTKILVTICNYNHSEYLKESIESIQNQTYRNIDICIYDDGSSDSNVVKDICESLKNEDPRIRTIYSPDNKGKWYGLNEAIKSSSAMICTSHDADDISLSHRIEMQYNTLTHTNTIHNLCGFYHCWNEDDINKFRNTEPLTTQRIMDKTSVSKLVEQGFRHPQINHYYTGEFETAGTTGMFYKEIWDRGTRFLPPGSGLRVLLSEDSDFNFRVTNSYASTSVLAEQLYLYRRNTSTNEELM